MGTKSLIYNPEDESKQQEKQYNALVIAFNMLTRKAIEKELVRLVQLLKSDIEKGRVEEVLKAIDKHLKLKAPIRSQLDELWDKGFILGNQHATDDVREQLETSNSLFSMADSSVANFEVSDKNLIKERNRLIRERKQLNFNPIAAIPLERSREVRRELERTDPDTLELLIATAQAQNRTIDDVTRDWHNSIKEEFNRVRQIDVRIDQIQTTLAQRELARREGELKEIAKDTTLTPEQRAKRRQAAYIKARNKERDLIKEDKELGADKKFRDTPALYKPIAEQIRERTNKEKLRTVDSSTDTLQNISQRPFGQQYLQQRNLEVATRFEEAEKERIKLAMRDYMDSTVIRSGKFGDDQYAYIKIDKAAEKRLIDKLLDAEPSNQYKQTPNLSKISILERLLKEKNIRTVDLNKSPDYLEELTKQQEALEAQIAKEKALKKLEQSFANKQNKDELKLTERLGQKIDALRVNEQGDYVLSRQELQGKLRELDVDKRNAGSSFEERLKKVNDIISGKSKAVNSSVAMTVREAKQLGLERLIPTNKQDKLDSEIEVSAFEITKLRSELYSDVATNREALKKPIVQMNVMPKVSRIANTELSAAYNIGRLNAYLNMGITHVLWENDRESTASRNWLGQQKKDQFVKVCDYCDERARMSRPGGIRIDELLKTDALIKSRQYSPRVRFKSTDNTEWIIPAHPYCRCYWKPILSRDKVRRTFLEDERVTSRPEPVPPVRTSIRNWVIGTGVVGASGLLLSMAVAYAAYAADNYQAVKAARPNVRVPVRPDNIDTTPVSLAPLAPLVEEQRRLRESTSPPPLVQPDVVVDVPPDTNIPIVSPRPPIPSSPRGPSSPTSPRPIISLPSDQQGTDRPIVDIPMPITEQGTDRPIINISTENRPRTNPSNLPRLVQDLDRDAVEINRLQIDRQIAQDIDEAQDLFNVREGRVTEQSSEVELSPLVEAVDRLNDIRTERETNKRLLSRSRNPAAIDAINDELDQQITEIIS